MKKNNFPGMMIPLLLAGLLLSVTVFSQNSKENKLIEDSKEAQAEFVKSDSLMQSYLRMHMHTSFFPI